MVVEKLRRSTVGGKQWKLQVQNEPLPFQQVLLHQKHLHHYSALSGTTTGLSLSLLETVHTLHQTTFVVIELVAIMNTTSAEEQPVSQKLKGNHKKQGKPAPT